MLKKYFDWTSRDIAYWEKVRQRGLLKFIIWYGVVISAGLFFVLFGLLRFFSWLRQAMVEPITSTSLVFLVGQLVGVLVVSLIAGVVNSLITWVVEEHLYRKYKTRSS